MSVKLIALGNVLMKDDGIGIEVSRQIEKRLADFGIDVIYGETDYNYGLSMLKEDDFLFVIDAAIYGKTPGEITSFPLESYVSENNDSKRINFIDRLKDYFPDIKGIVLAVEVSEVEFHYGLSTELQRKVNVIADEVVREIFDTVLAVQQTEEPVPMREFTLEELATYNGKNGNPPYVAINDIVYDMSGVELWKTGRHFGVTAGKDNTSVFMNCHQGSTNRIEKLPIVGVLKK